MLEGLDKQAVCQGALNMLAITFKLLLVAELSLVLCFVT